MHASVRSTHYNEPWTLPRHSMRARRSQGAPLDYQHDRAQPASRSTPSRCLSVLFQRGPAAGLWPSSTTPTPGRSASPSVLGGAEHLPGGYACQQAHWLCLDAARGLSVVVLQRREELGRRRGHRLEDFPRKKSVSKKFTAVQGRGSSLTRHEDVELRAGRRSPVHLPVRAGRQARAPVWPPRMPREFHTVEVCVMGAIQASGPYILVSRRALARRAPAQPPIEQARAKSVRRIASCGLVRRTSCTSLGRLVAFGSARS